MLASSSTSVSLPKVCAVQRYRTHGTLQAVKGSPASRAPPLAPTHSVPLALPTPCLWSPASSQHAHPLFEAPTAIGAAALQVHVGAAAHRVHCLRLAGHTLQGHDGHTAAPDQHLGTRWDYRELCPKAGPLLLRPRPKSAQTAGQSGPCLLHLPFPVLGKLSRSSPLVLNPKARLPGACELSPQCSHRVVSPSLGSGVHLKERTTVGLFSAASGAQLGPGTQAAVGRCLPMMVDK